jgi:prepilin-type N-terminal cleavage/methylation domain-containing protein
MKILTAANRSRSYRAFTLVELIVTIAIIGILATIGAVSYNSVVGASQDTARLAAAVQAAKVVQADSATQRVAANRETFVMSAAFSADLPQGWSPSQMVWSAVTGGVRNAVSNSQGCVITLAPDVGGWNEVNCPGVVGDGGIGDGTGGGTGGGTGDGTGGGTNNPGASFSFSYPSTVLSSAVTAQKLTPTVVNASGATSFAITAGELPPGVGFATDTGVFTGLTGWKLAALDVGVNYSHSCAVTSTGSVKCWGQNTSGKLGNGTGSNSASPVDVVGVSSAVSVSAGGDHTCVVLSDKTIQCWGENGSGELGNNSTSDSSSPVNVYGITNALSVDTSSYQSSCALLADGSVKCWGQNTYGKLGNNSTVNSSVPVNVYGITNAVGLSVGHVSSCALLAGGSVKCWGSNPVGQLGDGSTTGSPIPVSVTGITNAVDVSTSTGGNFSCAVISGGTVKCWGENAYGTLGNSATASANSSVPVNVLNITNAVSVTAGTNHACALLNDGFVQCWGLNTDNEIGDGSTTRRNVPTFVSGITNAKHIKAGVSTTCALLTDTSLKCWGRNVIIGFLGDGTANVRSTPVYVLGFTPEVGFPASVTVTGTDANSSTSVNVNLSKS